MFYLRFFFLLEKKQDIYDEQTIEKIFSYSVLRDRDSIYVFFIFIFKPESNLSDEKFRVALLKVTGKNEISHQFLIHHINFGKHFQ